MEAHHSHDSSLNLVVLASIGSLPVGAFFVQGRLYVSRPRVSNVPGPSGS